MSASREKKIRFEERAEGTEKRQVRAKSTRKANKHKKLITSAAVAVVVILVIVALVFNSTLFYTGMAALRVGDWKFTAADFNYEYFNSYYQTYETITRTYGEYASYLLDPQKPLNKQNYSETQTWEDYFQESAFSQLQQMAILNDMADAENWNLSAETQAEITKTIDSLKTEAVSNGYSDYKAYLRAMFGKGITEDRLRNLLNASFRATFYSQELLERWKAASTDAEKLEYYQGVQKEHNLITFMSYYVDGSANEEKELDAASAMAEAKAVADDIAGTADPDTFVDAVRSYVPEEQKAAYAGDDACQTRNVAPSQLSAEYKAWLTDESRQYGDTTVLVGSTGYTVIMYVESNDNSYPLTSYRGILIPVSTDEEGNINDQTLQAGQDTVDKILEAYNADPSEKTFSELADEYNRDGSVGGLHENISMGQLASHTLEDYLFDEAAREPGQIYSFYDNGYYYVIYFCGYGQQYNLFIADSLMTQEQYTGLIESKKEEYPVKTGFAFRFTK